MVTDCLHFMEVCYSTRLGAQGVANGAQKVLQGRSIQFFSLSVLTFCEPLFRNGSSEFKPKKLRDLFIIPSCHRDIFYSYVKLLRLNQKSLKID